MKDNSIFNRVKNVLVGCCYGDALGMPTEMLSHQKIKELFPFGINGFYPSTKEDFFNRKLPKGSMTDDTIHTILLVETLIENEGNVTAESYIKYLQKWYIENIDVAESLAGPSTIKALQLILNGCPIEKAGLLGRTNGALMKISPIGVIENYKNLTAFVDKVEQVCLATHNTSIAISGASCIAACISYGVRGGNNIDEMWNIACKAANEGLKRGNQMPFASIERRVKHFKNLINTKSYSEVLDLLVNVYGTTEQILDTIGAIVCAIEYGKLDIFKTAKFCAELGADTDTIGAISTAIAGSLGASASEDDIRLLSKVNNIDFDYYTLQLMKYMK